MAPPRLPKAKKRSRVLRVKLRPSEYRLARKFARHHGLATATWARDILLTAMGR